MNKKMMMGLALAALSVFSALCAACGNGPEENKKPPITYSQFGAVGDGVTDDFEAIIAAHEYANMTGRPVKAEQDATYYIGAHAATAHIQTDTDWGNAKFIIDDTEVTTENRSWNIFEVKSDYEPYKVPVPQGYSLEKGQENIGITFETPVLLYVVNSNKKDYIRYGLNQNGGANRQEILLVDEEGNVDKDTPVLWEYEEVTSIIAYPVCDEPVTVSGGEFTTIANRAPVSANYYARGINVKRSNTTVTGVSHYVTGEGEASSPYTGFYAVNYANAVTIENCLLTGHTTYTNIKPTGAVSQGTYDTQAVRSNAVTYRGCTQSNEVTDTKYWGVMASNFCKNLKMERCNLSRFDAHQGVYNATITDTVLGQNLTIIGAGTLRIENVTRLSGSHFMQLRTDYGSTWEGDILFKNCTYTPTGSSCCIIQAQWTDWDFGYTCYLPAEVVVDNFTVTGSAKCAVFSAVTSSKPATVQNSKNPYVVTERVIIKNEATPLQLSQNTSGLFDGVAVEKY